MEGTSLVNMSGKASIHQLLVEWLSVILLRSWPCRCNVHKEGYQNPLQKGILGAARRYRVKRGYSLTILWRVQAH